MDTHTHTHARTRAHTHLFIYACYRTVRHAQYHKNQLKLGLKILHIDRCTLGRMATLWGLLALCATTRLFPVHKLGNDALVSVRRSLVQVRTARIGLRSGRRMTQMHAVMVDWRGWRLPVDADRAHYRRP